MKDRGGRIMLLSKRAYAPSMQFCVIVPTQAGSRATERSFEKHATEAVRRRWRICATYAGEQEANWPRRARDKARARPQRSSPNSSLTLQIAELRDQIRSALTQSSALAGKERTESVVWLRLAEASQRLGGATYRLYEWPEPGDANVDVAHPPGVRPKRVAAMVASLDPNA
jgi:hypothetical protein